MLQNLLFISAWKPQLSLLLHNCGTGASRRMSLWFDSLEVASLQSSSNIQVTPQRTRPAQLCRVCLLGVSLQFWSGFLGRGQSSSAAIVKWHILELGAHGTSKTSILSGLAVDHLGIRDESNRCYAFKHLDKEMKLHILSKKVKLAFVCDVPFYSDKVLFVFKWKYRAWHNMTKP